MPEYHLFYCPHLYSVSNDYDKGIDLQSTWLNLPCAEPDLGRVEYYQALMD